MAYQFVGVKADPLARKGLSEVKSQLADTTEQISQLANMEQALIQPNWGYGGLNSSGNFAGTTPRNRARFERICLNETIVLKHNTFKSIWYLKSADNTTILKSSSAWGKTDVEINCEEGNILRIAVAYSDETSTFSFDAIDLIVSRKSNIVGKVEAVFTDKVKSEFEFVFPSLFTICAGIEQNIYHQNILRGVNTRKLFAFKTSLRFTDYDYFSRYTPSTSASTSLNYGHKNYAYKDNSNAKVDSPTMRYYVIAKNAGNGLNKKALLIGDSLTYNGEFITRHLTALFADDVMNVTFIGTLGTSEYPHEGRPGWGANTYVTVPSYTSDSGSTFQNAFWNPTTNKFDFSYYMEENDYNDVDYVFINLGANDLGEGAEAFNAAVNEIITSIHGYDPDIRIAIWLIPPRALTGIGNLVDNDRRLDFTKKVITEFDNKRSNRIYLIPVYFNVDPYNDFPTAVVPVSARNTDKTMIIATDKVHPTESGYKKIGDMIYSTIKYFGYLDA